MMSNPQTNPNTSCLELKATLHSQRKVKQPFINSTDFIIGGGPRSTPLLPSLFTVHVKVQDVLDATQNLTNSS